MLPWWRSPVKNRARRQPSLLASHLKASQLAELHEFIFRLLRWQRFAGFSGLCVYCLMWRTIKYRLFWSSSLPSRLFKAVQGERAQRPWAGEADVSLRCWQTHYNWPRQNKESPHSRKWRKTESSRRMKRRGGGTSSNEAVICPTVTRTAPRY